MLKNFATNNKNNNPFTNHISDDCFKKIIESGFEKSNLDCYADLKGDICYKKHLVSSVGWDVNIYITEQGIAVDHDYDCGGNSSHWTFWFDDGTYNVVEYFRLAEEPELVEYEKIKHTFEEAWNNMIELSNSL